MAKQLTWALESRKVADLIPADYNPRKLTDKAKSDLEKSVQSFGQVEPLVINRDGTIIGGHSRVKVYADLEIMDTPVMVPNRQLTEDEERELNLRLNKNVGEWDPSKLKEFFGVDFLKDVGFEDGELRVWFGLEEANTTVVDENRMQVLMVNPPESPKLRERVAVHFKDKKEYDLVKAWINANPDEVTKILVEAAS